MLEAKLKKTETGTPILLEGTPKDVPTILVNGIAGVQIDEFSAKITFFEQTTGENGSIVGRVIVTLATGRAQLGQLRDALTSVIDAVAAAESGAGAPSSGPSH